jgi:polyisoprenoid-binding protein YceI
MTRTTVTTEQLTTALAALLLAGTVTLDAQQPNLDFTVSGTSTIRGWTCTAKGTMAVTPGPGGGPAVPGFAKGVQSATVTVPVKAFTCPNAEMTEHLMQAMKPDQFPEIVYKLEKYDVAGDRAQATGTMTIQGRSQPLNLPVVVKASGAGVALEGNTRLDMTTYGVEPPVVMLGMLKVGPQIRIEFKGLVMP